MSNFSFIDEILVNYFNETGEAINNGNFNGSTVYTNAGTKAKQALIQGFKAAMLEVIGEDEKTTKNPLGTPQGVYARNALRNYQRQALETLVKGEENE